MTEAEIIALFRQLIRQELPPILVGMVVSNESETRSTVKRFPNEAPRTKIRSILPFGVASKAPVGTPAFVVPAGDQTNLNMIGHFDEISRPPIDDGDVALYDAHGHVLYLSSGKIQLGSQASAENLVLGKVFKTLMSKLLEEISQHQHLGNLGYATSPPSNRAAFEALKASPVDDSKVLSDVAFSEKGS